MCVCVFGMCIYLPWVCHGCFVFQRQETRCWQWQALKLSRPANEVAHAISPCSRPLWFSAHSDGFCMLILEMGETYKIFWSIQMHFEVFCDNSWSSRQRQIRNQSMHYWSSLSLSLPSPPPPPAPNAISFHHSIFSTSALLLKRLPIDIHPEHFKHTSKMHWHSLVIHYCVF